LKKRKKICKKGGAKKNDVSISIRRGEEGAHAQDDDTKKKKEFIAFTYSRKPKGEKGKESPLLGKEEGKRRNAPAGGPGGREKKGNCIKAVAKKGVSLFLKTEGEGRPAV